MLKNITKCDDCHGKNHFPFRFNNGYYYENYNVPAEYIDYIVPKESNLSLWFQNLSSK